MPWGEQVASDLLEVALLSLFVSGIATIIAAAVSIPLGSFIGLREFRGKSAIKALTHTLYGFPPVIAGLIVFMALSRSGPLGTINVLFTPTAMILAQILLVAPIITGLTISAVSEEDPCKRDTAKVLGATEWQVARTVLREARGGVISAVMIGFGRAIAEVGAVIIVGGNIKWHTRVLTTAIVLETRQGNFDYAIVLGLFLMVITMSIFFFFQRYQGREPS